MKVALISYTQGHREGDIAGTLIWGPLKEKRKITKEPPLPLPPNMRAHLYPLLRTGPYFPLCSPGDTTSTIKHILFKVSVKIKG